MPMSIATRVLTLLAAGVIVASLSGCRDKHEPVKPTVGQAAIAQPG